MEDNVILQVTLHENEGIEIYVGGNSVSPLSLIGILEQVKFNILSNNTAPNLAENNKPKYDA
jgi:hypothetical protein